MDTSQIYQHTSLINHSICSWPRLIVWMFVIKTFVINCSVVSNSDSHIGDQGVAGTLITVLV